MITACTNISLDCVVSCALLNECGYLFKCVKVLLSSIGKFACVWIDGGVLFNAEAVFCAVHRWNKVFKPAPFDAVVFKLDMLQML